LNVGTSPTVHEKETGRSVVIVYWDLANMDKKVSKLVNPQ
jgi:hypothetical protein